MQGDWFLCHGVNPNFPFSAAPNSQVVPLQQKFHQRIMVIIVSHVPLSHTFFSLSKKKKVTMSLVSRTKNKCYSKTSDFSIEHILNVAGKKQNLEEIGFSSDVMRGHARFEWLNCTRYKPPKLPRQRKKEGIQRRKSGRNPRIPFSSSQIAHLEAKFLRTPYLNSSDVAQLASHLQLTETRVKIWFQNRRAREKKEKEIKNNMIGNSIQDTQPSERISEKPHIVESAPMALQKAYPSNYSTCTRLHINYIEPKNFVQTLTPLDLSDKLK